MDIISEIALALTPGVGCTIHRKLLARFGSAEAVFSLSAVELRTLFPNQPALLNSLVNKTMHARAEREWQWCNSQGVRVLSLAEGTLPRRMQCDETSDCPAVLYVKGNVDLDAEHAVAIVGTRRATAYGCDFTNALVRDLKPLGAPIISGLSYGIDTAAHRAALDHALPTVAVMAHGLDRIYPPQNRQLAERIVQQGGALVTEYASGTAINQGFFPARNRIIAALADGVVVVEAGSHGGALITAHMAASYHRDVFAVPGRATDPYSQGTNALIAANKAQMLCSANDIMQQMGWGSQPHATMKEPTLFDQVDDDARRVVELLKQQEVLAIDELSPLTGLSLQQLASLLFNLEMQDIVIALPGHRYRLRLC